MPPRDLRSFSGLMADLWAGLSPIMRVCGFAGLALGAGFGLWLVGGISSGGRRVLQLLLGILVGLTILGTLLGLAVGAVIEWLWRRDK